MRYLKILLYGVIAIALVIAFFRFTYMSSEPMDSATEQLVNHEF